MKQFEKTKILKFLILVLIFGVLVKLVIAVKPEFINVPTYIEVAQDSTYNFTVTANDSEQEYPLNFTDDSEGIVDVFDMRKINQTAALINFTPTNDDVNEHNGGTHITIVLKDSSFETEVQDVLINITNVNDPPNITSYYPSDLTPSVIENSSLGFSFNYTATDPDIPYGDVLTVEWLKNGVNQSPNTTWTYRPNFCESGSYNITLNVTDSGDLSDTQSWNLSVNNTNRPPQFNKTIENISMNEDVNTSNVIYLDDYFFDNDTLECSGANQDDLTYNVTGNNSVKVIINESNNNVSFHITANWFGNETIYFTVSDGYNTTNSNNITINVTNVNDAPVLTFIDNQTLAENVSFSLTATATDPDNTVIPGLDTLTYYDNTSLFDINPSTGLISFTPDNLDVGINMVNITVGDGSLNDSQIVQFNVSSNNPPILNPIGNKSGEEASLFFVVVIATDQDNEVLTFASNFTQFSMDVVNSTAANFSFTPDNSDVGNHSINFTVTDEKGSIDWEIIVLNITNINNPPVLDFIENQTVTLNKTFMLNVTASDADSDSLTYYTNDSMFNITTINSSYGFFNLTFNSTNDIGNYTVNVTVSDGTLNDSQLVGFFVYDNRQPVFDTYSVQNLTEDTIFLLNISASDPDNDELTFGTNSSLFNLTAINTTMAKLNFTPNSSHVGLLNFSFNVTDGRHKVNLTILFNVSEFNDVPYFDPPLVNFSGMQDVLFTYNVNATDEENGTDEVDGNLLFWTNATFFTIDENNGLINFTPQNSDVGNHTIQIAVNDTINRNMTVIWFIILQYNDPPNITSYAPNATNVNVTENSSQQFNITFDEPDSDTVTFSWLLDGVQQTTNGNWTYSPGFNDAGNHNVTVEISDGSLTDFQYWNVTVINFNRKPLFGVNIQTNQTHFTAGTNTQTNATAEAGNISLVRNTSTTYYESGNYTSANIDLGPDSTDILLTNISWQGYTEDGVNITMETRSSSDLDSWTSWSDSHTNPSGTPINSTDNRYIQYRALFVTNHTNKTPVLEEVRIEYYIDDFTGVEDTVYVNWIDLDDFFYDPDGNSLNYSVNVSSSSLTVSIVNVTNLVTLTPASDWYGSAEVIFTATDSLANITSNLVTITFTDVSEPSTTTESSGGGGGGGGSSTVIRTQTRFMNVSEPQFFELIVPGLIHGGPNSTIIAPITLVNYGNKTLNGIDMFATSNTTSLTFEFTKRNIDKLVPGSTTKTDLIIKTHNVSGSMSVRVEARVKSPSLTDSAIIQLSVLENVSNRIRYVRDLFLLNPECLELNELVLQAQSALQSNEYSRANFLLDQAIEGCRYLLTTGTKEFKLSTATKSNLNLLLTLAMFAVVLILLGIYYLMRRRNKPKHKRREQVSSESEGEIYT